MCRFLCGCKFSAFSSKSNEGLTVGSCAKTMFNFVRSSKLSSRVIIAFGISTSSELLYILLYTFSYYTYSLPFDVFNIVTF